MERAGKFGIVALVALALTALPGGDATLNVVLTLLSIAFFTAIAYFAYRLFMQFRDDIAGLPERQRLVLYSSVGLIFLTFAATSRMFNAGGLGVLAWLALLGLCSYGLYRVWTRYREYG